MDPKEVREKTVRDAKTALILDAGMKVFAEKGYHGTRLEDIAAAAGFSKAALYNYYDSKEAIFLSLAVREYERLYEKLTAQVDPSQSLAANLERVLRAILELCGEHFALLLEVSDFRVTTGPDVAALAQQHAALAGDLRERFLRMQRVFTGMMAAARARGEVHSPLSDQALASFLGAQIRGVMFQWKLAGAKGDIRRDVRDVLEFCLRGMRAGGAA